jgi:hypothetical protein
MDPRRHPYGDANNDEPVQDLLDTLLRMKTGLPPDAVREKTSAACRFYTGIRDALGRPLGIQRD